MQGKEANRYGWIGWLMCMAVGVIFCISPCLAGEKKFNLKLQHFTTGNEFERSTKDSLCPLVEKMTNGSIKISPFAGGSLVPVKEMINATSMGMIDIAYFVGGYCAGLVPVAEIMGGLPCAYGNVHDAHIFMWHRGFIDILRKEFAKHNLYVIPVECYNIGLMTNKPINKISDLKGMKLRSHSTLATWLSEAGASVVFVPATELYTALATGVVDGASWGDAGPMYEMKFPEVLKNYMLPEPLIGAWNVLLINLDVWNKFSLEQKRAFKGAAMFATKVTQAQTGAFYYKALNSMVNDFGVKINTLPEEEQKKAKEISEKTMRKLKEKNPLNAKVLDMVDAYMKEKDVCPKIAPLPW